MKKIVVALALLAGLAGIVAVTDMVPVAGAGPCWNAVGKWIC
jgi:hypothetical protein